MVKVVNKLSKFPKTQKYVDLGLKQARQCNKEFLGWIKEQKFNDAGASIIKEVEIDGYSNENLQGRQIGDRIEWEFKFAKKVNNKGLSDLLLHQKRAPIISTLNSAPDIFTTANYIKVAVTNGERGWVQQGLFPINVHIEQRYEEDIHYRSVPKDVAVQTNVRREALAGIKALKHWQRFRSMALNCSGLIEEKLKADCKNANNYDAHQHFKIREEHAYKLFLELLPKIGSPKDPQSLKKGYLPGALESEIALTFEDYMDHSAWRINDSIKERAFYEVTGFPLAILPHKNGYDAFLRFNVEIKASANEKDEPARLLVERELSKYFDVELRTPTEINVSHKLADASEIAKAIIDGDTNTALHTYIRNFGDAILHVNSSLKQWYGETIPVLKKGYDGLIANAKEQHFSGLGRTLEENVK